jgi:hypothetical protein
MLAALIWLSEGHDRRVSMEIAGRGRSAFAERNRIAFVVVDRARTSEAIREFAIRAFNLQLIESDGNLDLYRPTVAETGS